ncbi:MAG TPA: FHA domain-containing protein, partial [Bdellovibrionota bacterium]|nr:FHA domain-containing protein [Bdellovibrionota bacterium]
MPRLIIKRGEETGKVIDLRDGSFTIGRNPNNEIVLHSPAISKQHARLTVKGRQVIIEDLGSANGTFVNGAMITSYQLKTGDQIHFRDLTLELLDGEPVHLNQPTQSLGTGTYGLPLPHVLQGTPQGTPHLQLVHNSINREGPLKTLFQNIGRFCQDQILPLFYKLVESIEWHLVVAGLSIIFIVATVVMTVAPLSTQSKAYLQSETRKKAIFLAKQLAEENRRGVYLKNEVILSTKVVDG